VTYGERGGGDGGRVTRSMTKALELGQVMRATTKRDTAPRTIGVVKRAVSRGKGKGRRTGWGTETGYETYDENGSGCRGGEEAWVNYHRNGVSGYCGISSFDVSVRVDIRLN
jgi:hypothetical protein